MSSESDTFTDIPFVQSANHSLAHSREGLACIVRERVANGGNMALLEACQEAEARYA